MTEKDTNYEETQDEEFYDNYNETDDYYINKALGNIKNDEGTARSRPARKPLYQIRIEDEEQIPKMPDKIIRDPKDEDFKKRINDLKAKNKQKSDNIKENIEKIKQEKLGIRSDDKMKIIKELKEVKTKIKDLNKEINDHEQSIAPIKNKFNLLNNKVKSYERYRFPHNPKRVAQELKKLREKISFAAINVTEETELIKRKDVLEEYEKALNEFLKFKEQNNEALNKTKKPREEKAELKKKLEEIQKQLDQLEAKKEVKNPEIERLNILINSLKQDKQEISKQIKEIYKEWDNQWYEYNEQQKLIKYIKDAKAKIKNLKKRKKNEEDEEGNNNEETGEKTDKKDKKDKKEKKN